MDWITLQNYRCFGSEEQTARLAPLTLLVGQNSTGKTSFLALIRALSLVAFWDLAPDFREEPYDLGSFQDIVHNRGGRGAQGDRFEAGFAYDSLGEMIGGASFRSTFKDHDGAPYPVLRRIERGQTGVKLQRQDDGDHWFSFRTAVSEWKWQPQMNSQSLGPDQLLSLIRWIFTFNNFSQDNSDITEADVAEISALQWEFHEDWSRFARPFAGAPLRSRPRRTYDPTRPSLDPTGENIPSYLAGLSRRDPDAWQRLKSALEGFGRASGLFDEISVRSFGKTDGEPFQIHVRKFGKRRKGPWRNLIDVGYGVSQTLPLLTELLREDRATVFLLQQPEVHLHPSAQAALGSLFCQIAADRRQLIIETHSDYIIDRVRMDVRDKVTGLKPEDVSILYFEPGDLDVKIHSIRLDEMGNVLGAPPGYRDFFMAEIRRSIGL